jgi:putative hydrolases of HD superfamily
LSPINPILGTKIRTAWLEYEEGKTAEAQFIRDMDKFECMVQAYEYEQRTFGEENLEEFQGLSSKISSPEGKVWLELL